MTLNRWSVISLSLLSAIVFVWLSSVQLDGQGLYYDELHQATAAFAYLGSPDRVFAPVTIDDLVPASISTRFSNIPLLNMHYSGAIKSAVYGLYLRFVTPHFSVISWRLTGIFLVAFGLIALPLLAYRSVSLAVLVVILGLLVTDVTVILCVRHDWGPVALALMLRLLLIGVWLRGERTGQPSHCNSFILGALVGFAVFEKLSSLVLALPLAIFFLSGNRCAFRHLLAVLGGVFVGALPLLVLNTMSLLTHGNLISLINRGKASTHTWHEFLQYVWAYVSLGAGADVTQFILGDSTLPLATALEPWLITGGLILAGSVTWSTGLRERPARLMFTALLCYVVVAIAVYLIPRETWVHHWVLGTPFQYVALGLAFESFRYKAPTTALAPVRQFLLRLVVITLLTVRLAGLGSLEYMLWRKDASPIWHPNLTQIGLFAAGQTSKTLFVAADWGVATQIYCLSNGRHGLVREIFASYGGPDDLLRLQKQYAASVVYVVSLNPPSNVRPENTRRIFQDFESGPHWRETKVEPGIANFIAVTVRKFIFVP